MAITYTWKIGSIKKQNTDSLNEVIIQTYWRKIGEDENGNIGTFHGATPFNPETIDPDNFTAYEDLTQEQVLSWIQAKVVGEYEAHVNQKIQDQINQNFNQIEEVNNPFNNPEEVMTEES